MTNVNVLLYRFLKDKEMTLLKTVHSDDLTLKVYKTTLGYRLQMQGFVKHEELFTSAEKLVEIYEDDFDMNDLK